MIGEIKFRVWDGKQMWKDVAVYNNKPYVWNNLETELVPLFNEEQGRLYGKPILMQFTGLKDCKGVEIYEGDKITTNWKNTAIAIVLWHLKGCWGLKWNKDGEGYNEYLPFFSEDIEVIGNIYEEAK